MKLFPRLRARLDPRKSLAARLLFALFLAFLIPGAIFVFLLERRVRDLRGSSLAQFAAARRAQISLQLEQDAHFRAEWIEHRVEVTEEAAWWLARAVQKALTLPTKDSPAAPPRDKDGQLWPGQRRTDAVAFVRPDRIGEESARRDYERLRAIAPLMVELRERRRTIKTVAICTDTGAAQISPWLDIPQAGRPSQAELERFAFNRYAQFPARIPATGDLPVWTGAGGPRLIPEPHAATLFVPVRDGDGKLLATVSLGVDARRYVMDSLDPGTPVGDLWFAVDSAGRAVLMPLQMAELLHWRGVGMEGIADSPDVDRQRLASGIFSAPTMSGDYRFAGRAYRFASARVRSAGWIFVEGFSPAALARIGREAAWELPPKLFSDLEGYLLIVFTYLLLVVFTIVVILSRRTTAPVKELVDAAEAIGQGRAVEITGVEKQDELGRLASAIDRMGKRVERRVETLRRLHSLLRTVYHVTDFREILARASEAIAAFTRAERVFFMLHDPDTNRLEAAWPGWNVSEDLATQLRVSVESRSISSMVFKSGELYVSNDIAHDPYTSHALRDITKAENAMFCPVKTEETTLGVVVATNRPGGFGHEEVDAMTSLADAAALLISNARLYSVLTGTVEELRRASRLKDHFLQNVNHELRTPLTAIVGWTDLLEEEKVDQATLQRGLKQVRQSARILLALIDDLLDLARMDRGALALELRPVSLPEVLQHSLDTVRLMAETRGVVLIQAPLPEDLIPFRADPLRLQQILWNLLANAIKFTPRHGRVILRVDREPERFLISVEDDGIGIPESDLPHVFERFRQVDGSPTRRHPGMGIGLALARSLVELHGGTIWAESLPDRGSRFTFSIPISLADRRSSAVQSVPVGQSEEN